MSMICDVYALSQPAVTRLLSDPDGEVASLLDGEGEDTGPSVSLEKSWHGLHYLLNGSADPGDPPLDFLISGGEQVGSDLGYGPARLLPARVTRVIHAAVSGISDEQLWSRFDRATMTAQDVYPTIWHEPEENLRAEYLSYFQELKDVLEAASRAEMALLVVLT